MIILSFVLHEKRLSRRSKRRVDGLLIVTHSIKERCPNRVINTNHLTFLLKELII